MMDLRQRPEGRPWRWQDRVRAAIGWIGWTTSRRAGSDARDAAALASARGRLEQDDPATAAQIASDVAARSRTARMRNAALTTLAWAGLAQGDLARARSALDRVEPRHALDLYCFAAVQSACGNPELAIRALELARNAGTLCREGAKLLVDLYVRQDRMDRAVASALVNRKILGLDNCRLVVKGACDAGAYGPAAAFAAELFEATCAPEDAAAWVRALAYERKPGTVPKALDEAVGRFRRLGKLAHARSLLLELRLDRSLPSGIRPMLDRILPTIDGVAPPVHAST
jgi:hypothetical protein